MGPSEINRPYLILGESLNYIYHIYDFVRSDMRVNIKILFMSNFLTISIKCVPIFSKNVYIFMVLFEKVKANNIKGKDPDSCF